MKKKTNNDWAPWQQKLVLFICTFGLFLIVVLDYGNFINNENTSSTRGRIFHDTLQQIDLKFGKEYVIGILILILIVSGFSAFKGYINSQDKKQDE